MFDVEQTCLYNILVLKLSKMREGYKEFIVRETRGAVVKKLRFRDCCKKSEVSASPILTRQTSHRHPKLPHFFVGNERKYIIGELFCMVSD